jgi:hypothetical protein
MTGKIPELNRARGWRIYLKAETPETGVRRLVDLWQYGGRALLGHNPPGMLRSLKNGAERGLYAPPPPLLSCAAQSRLTQALTELFSGGACFPAVKNCRFAFYRDESSLRRAAGNVPLLRPFLAAEPQAAAGSSGGAFVPVLPFPFPGAPSVLVYSNGEFSSDAVSPAALECAARCVRDLIAASPVRGKVRYSKLNKSPGWKREGIYLFYQGGENGESYEQTCRRFFDKGFLLPPPADNGLPADPAILPGELSPGEEARLAGLFA